MLLVLAQPEDEAADRFERKARSWGLAVERASAETISLCVGLDRSGCAAVDLKVRGASVHAVLNRGHDIDPAKQFENSEWLAAWWSALAHFPGPVINRPSRDGFLPDLDALALAARVPGLALAPMYIGPEAPLSLINRTFNVHSVRDGRFIGRNVGDDEELSLYTDFDPALTRRIIFAGNKRLESGRPLQSSFAGHDAIDKLENELRRLGATFSSVVLQHNASCVELLQATPLPQTSHFAEIEDEVHEALIEYLRQ